MSIYEKLYDWQKKIIDTFCERKSFGIFLDMGLGKTPLSLAFAERNKCSKVIIVTLNNKAIEKADIKGSWLNWASNSHISYRLCNKNTKEFDDSPTCLVVNYESLFEREEKLKTEKVTLRQSLKQFIYFCKNENIALILDESHKVKNLNSIQTNAVLKLQKELNRVGNLYTYLLTGTPFTQGYIDLYTQLKVLGCNMTKGDFKDAFCEIGHIKGLLDWQQPIVGYKNLNELFRIIHNYAITMKSTDVIQLPEQVFKYYKLEKTEEFDIFTKEKAKISDINHECKKRKLELFKLEKDKQIPNPFFRNIAYPDMKWLATTTGTFWLRARQLSIGFQGNADESIWYDKTRLKDVEELLKNNEDNYLLFYNFTPELLEIYSICEKLGYNIDIYCGEIKSLNHYENYCKLTESEKLVTKKNIILANFASGSTGMNWQEYNKCIIFSCPLYKDYEQGIKRLHRIGQTQTTFYYIFYQDNWLDTSMMKALKTKINYSTQMFESDINKNNLIN